MGGVPDSFNVWAKSMMAYGGAERLEDRAPENAAASVIQTALEEARAEERRAVTAWLRTYAELLCKNQAIVLITAADTIERGKHHGRG
ncbi:hypothetical protein LH128_05278 [Sphingomonas sp. LH128]|uniref:hypothetical protein n=1 Tax=Sphingomonas sp. LH128 TaxID=473781 RepID=UPI00027C9B2B|nr:hypothetical protein [Sphingomonas sp. LH128]EJU14144.1 hypothetical protein LH128_05278 [Sphingomonas sp. LH128]